MPRRSLFGVERNTSSRFWMANQRFCIAYLFRKWLRVVSRLRQGNTALTIPVF